MKAAQSRRNDALNSRFFHIIASFVRGGPKDRRSGQKIVISLFFVLSWPFRIVSQDHYLGAGPAFLFSPLTGELRPLGTPHV